MCPVLLTTHLQHESSEKEHDKEDQFCWQLTCGMSRVKRKMTMRTSFVDNSPAAWVEWEGTWQRGPVLLTTYLQHESSEKEHDNEDQFCWQLTCGMSRVRRNVTMRTSFVDNLRAARVEWEGIWQWGPVLLTTYLRHESREKEHDNEDRCQDTNSHSCAVVKYCVPKITRSKACQCEHLQQFLYCEMLLNIIFLK